MTENEETNLLQADYSNPDQKADAKSSDLLSRIKGVVAIFLFTVLIGVSKISDQALNRSIPDFELNALRCGFATACMGLYHLVTKTSMKISKENALSIMLLNLAINLLTICTYVAVTFIPVASVECLLQTSALSSGLIVYRLVNKEKLKCDKLVAVPLCITGVFLVLQPEFVFGDNNKYQDQIFNVKLDKINASYLLDFHNLDNNNFSISTNPTNEAPPCDSTLATPGYVISVAAGLLVTIEISTLKYYENFFTTGNIFKSLFWTYLLGAVLSLIPMIIYEHPVLPNGFNEMLLVILHICTYVFTMPLVLYGSLLISGNLSTIIKTCILFYLLAAQYTILKDIHPGHRNWIEILGVILVLFGTIFTSIVEIVKGFKAEN